jgi:hypothetical protein
VRKFGLRFIFSLSGSFLLYVMAPLHFAHLDHFVSSNSSHGIDDFGGVFCVGQISLYTEFLHRQLLF